MWLVPTNTNPGVSFTGFQLDIFFGHGMVIKSDKASPADLAGGNLTARAILLPEPDTNFRANLQAGFFPGGKLNSSLVAQTFYTTGKHISPPPFHF